jgi:hypothetical protein
MRTWLKILIVLFVVGLISAFLVYKYVYNKPHPDFESMSPDYSLSAQELYSNFTSDKTTSETKYNGKVIEISGALSKVETTDSLVIAVFALNQGVFGDEGVRCSMLKKYHDETKLIAPGTQVKIKGYCTGFNDTDVIVEQCGIIK